MTFNCYNAKFGYLYSSAVLSSVKIKIVLKNSQPPHWLLVLSTSTCDTSAINFFYDTSTVKTFEPRHDKTNIMGLRPAWIQTSLRIRAV
jgi:hypothetical protein